MTTPKFENGIGTPIANAKVGVKLICVISSNFVS